ncbi:MAG: Holliday junction resolvase RuvX [Chloroflexi bacterium]|nr:Holliday junction resolvase RuvX [Chloroflexota bacterium]
MRILALDPGRRRVGIAISDPSGTIARPLMTLERGSRACDFERIHQLVVTHGVERVVVGLPLTPAGKRGAQARTVVRYAEALAVELPVSVVLWDERYSTVAAQSILAGRREKRTSSKRQSDDVDAVAAAVVLQAYLDEAGPVHGYPGDSAMGPPLDNPGDDTQ